MSDPFNLQRFLDAQDPIWDRVVEELSAGRRRSQWMWFVFPQLRDLGRSDRAEFYGISGLEEARAYWAHPVLGPRLKQAIELTLTHKDGSAFGIFGWLDHWKFHSCLTLFEQVECTNPTFGRAICKFFGGARDARTLHLIWNAADRQAKRA